MDKKSMVQELFELVDVRADLDKIGSFFAEDAIFVFANQEPIQGRAKIQAVIEGIHQSTKACKHVFSGIWVVEDTVICRGDCTFTLFDDRKVTVPFVDICQLVGDQIKHHQVYADLTPLTTAAEEATQV